MVYYNYWDLFLLAKLHNFAFEITENAITTTKSVKHL